MSETCLLCKSPVDETNEGDLRHDTGPETPRAEVHRECLLDYFAWLKRKGKPLAGNWGEEAKKLYEGV